MKDTKMSINFEYEGKDYKLEFTASSLKKMERQGFSFSDLERHALTAPEDLFCGAFIEHHNSTPAKIRREIYALLCSESEGGDALNEIIFQMVSEAIEEINSHAKGNLKWSLNK